MAKRPVGHPRTVNKDLPRGQTRSGKPPRVRVSAGSARDEYAYRKAYEEKSGKKLPTNIVLDHADESLASKRNPSAKVSPVTRSENSKAGGGIRHYLAKKKKGK